MGHVARFFRRLLNVIRPERGEAELDRELAAHLALLEDEHRRRGLPPDEAQKHARLDLGGIEQTKEQHRDARAFRWIDDARRDATYAVRMLRRYPVGSTTSALSLALGIGLNAAVFSVVDWVLLRPLPYPAAHELVRVSTAGTSPVTPPGEVTYEEFSRFARAHALRAAAAFSTTTRVMSGGGSEPTHVVIARVAGDLFATMGVGPETGRRFDALQLAAGAPVVILSHQVWRQRFSSEPDIVGRTIAIEGDAHTIVGVMPPGRGYPRDADVWRPLMASEREDNDRDLTMIGRLADGATVDGATAQLATAARVASEGERTAWADDLQRTEVGQVSAALEALLAAAMLTLLIACANVAALAAARAGDRALEMAVRGALGATRARVIGQLIIEGVILALAGGVLGLLVGRWALAALLAAAPVSIPRLAEITLDGRILAAGLGVTVLAGFAVGVTAALRLSRLSEASGPNRLNSQRVTRRPTGRRALVLAQVALAAVLTVGAGLLSGSLGHLVALDNGFTPDPLVAVDLNLRGGFAGDTRRLMQALVLQCESLPGVQSASTAMRLPTQVAGIRAPVRVWGSAESGAPATLRPVGSNYFDTVGLRLIAGRPFTNTDTAAAPHVAIVNETFVRTLLGGRPAPGVRLTTPLMDGSLSIVGVAHDITPAGEPDRPALYVPVDQHAIGGGYLIVRAHGDARGIMAPLRARIRAAAPSLAVDRMHRVSEELEDSRAVIRFATQVGGAFAGLALVLSMIGVYGLTAGDVSARWREIAVRLALGASRRQALWTVMRPCAIVVGAGAALGMFGALGVAPALASLLRGIGPGDVRTLIVAPVLLGAMGVLAALLAARRVLRADPAATLRNE